MLDKSNELLESIDSKLDKLIAYLRFESFAQLKEALPKLLDTPEKRLVFQACDGKSGINDMARTINISPMNVSNWVRKFESQGIVFSNLYKNKKCPLKIIDLNDIGIAVPKITNQNGIKGEEIGESTETNNQPE
ncbi:MAG: hypothetical protein HY361_00555 [Candidatus Aenigmarchaeota archaeon]|nr:hypothetical protein [Candidatus Aenigmarchaeota archaeon]